MDRSDLGFVGCCVGACVLAAGVLGYAAGWVFVAAGGLLAVAGLATLGIRGSAALLLTGAWLAASPAVPWAFAQWNLLVAGLLAVGLGFTVGVAGARP